MRRSSAWLAQRLANGELPYAQVFDHKPPGLYLLIGLGDLLGGPLGAWRVSWLISAAAAALTGVLVADTLRLLGWRRLAWLCGGLCTALLASFPLALGGGLGETVAVLPAAAAVRLGAAGSVGSRRSFAIGALAAAAAAISLQAVPALFAVLVMAALNSDRGRRAAAERILGMAWIGVGAASVMSALVILLGSAGATGAAVQAVIGYNRAFAGLAGRDDPMAGQAMHAVLVLAPLLVPAVIGLPATLSHAARRPVAIGALTWIGALDGPRRGAGQVGAALPLPDGSAAGPARARRLCPPPARRRTASWLGAPSWPGCWPSPSRSPPSCRPRKRPWRSTRVRPRRNGARPWADGSAPIRHRTRRSSCGGTSRPSISTRIERRHRPSSTCCHSRRLAS